MNEEVCLGPILTQCQRIPPVSCCCLAPRIDSITRRRQKGRANGLGKKKKTSNGWHSWCLDDGPCLHTQKKKKKKKKKKSPKVGEQKRREKNMHTRPPPTSKKCIGAQNTHHHYYYPLRQEERILNWLSLYRTTRNLKKKSKKVKK